MEDKKITEKESLEIITAMISRTKDRYIGDANIMLMWGYLCVGVALLVWGLIALTHNQVWNWLWFLIWIIGGTATPVMARKKLVSLGVKSYSDRLVSRIWSAVGITCIVSTFSCLAFLLIGGIDAWSMMLAFALIIVPFAEIVQGIVLKESSLVAGGSTGMLAGIVTVCCIAGGVPLRASWFMPMFILAFAAMMIAPGHILNSKARQA